MPTRAALEDVVGPEHGFEQASGTEDVRGVLGEHVEKSFFTGDQSQAQRGLLGRWCGSGTNRHIVRGTATEYRALAGLSHDR